MSLVPPGMTKESEQISKVLFLFGIRRRLAVDEIAYYDLHFPADTLERASRDRV